MELNATTFLLELVNFLALIWVLKKLFFAPVKKALDARHNTVMNTLADAKQQKESAEALRAQYESRLSDWQKEKNEKALQLENEIEILRVQKTAKLEKDLENDRRSKTELMEKQQTEIKAKLTREAIEQSTQFASRLLTNFSCPQLEERIVTFGLQMLDQNSIDLIRRSEADIFVTTAFDISETRNKIQTQLSAFVNKDAKIHFKSDSNLIAGMRLAIESWVIDINLRSELNYFSQGFVT